MQPLNVTPIPLIFSEKPIVLSFSPKSACSHAIIWFLLQEDLLDQANAYSTWPHDYRNKIYYKSETYLSRKLEFTSADPKDWTLLKFTRNPAKRLVSQYRHCVRYNVIDRQIENQKGLSMGGDGLSFNEFVSVLRNLPRSRPSPTDPHVCAQRHPVWQLPFGRMVTINADECDVNSTLNALEGDVGLPVTDFSNQATFKRIEDMHYAQKLATAPQAPEDGWANLKFTRQDIAEKAYFPKQELLPFAEDAAPSLFPRDMDSTHCADTAKRIFP